MESLADRAIAALRREHDSLSSLVRGLSDDQLAAGSGASDWPVAQVLSHLGSGAEIALAGLQAVLGERDQPGDDFNPSVWDRWNAMSASEQRAGFLEHDARLVDAVSGLSAEQRTSLEFPVGFLPAPLHAAGFAGMRLNEAALHGWDVRVSVDPDAEVSDATAAVLLELFAADLGFLLGFAAKTDRLPEAAVIDLAGSGYALTIGSGASVVMPVAGATAVLSGPLGAVPRLLSGRLRPHYTPADVSVSGNVSIDQLREVFPGF